MPNRILPDALRTQLALMRYHDASGREKSLTRDARFLFFHLWMAMDNYYRCPVGPSPAAPSVLRAMCCPADTDIRLPDVARWLHELQLAGAVAVRDSDRGWYVEIAEHLWYRRDDYAEHQPKYGPRLDKPLAQTALPLGPVDALPPPGGGARGTPRVPQAKMPTQAHTSTESRSKTIPNHAGAHPREAVDSGTRGLEPGKTRNFERDASDFPGDSRWQDVVLTLGLTEMTANGAMWAKRWQDAAQRDAIWSACMDWKAKTPAERGAGRPGAYVTKALTNARKAS